MPKMKTHQGAAGRFEGRKQRKRDFRALWIQRINAGAREHDLSYSRLIHGLRLAEIDLDRKILADLAVTEPEIFGAIVAQAKNALDGKPVDRRGGGGGRGGPG